MVISNFGIWIHNSIQARCTHVVVDALSRLVDTTKLTCVPNQTKYVALFQL